MIKAISIILSIYFFVGTAILPKGDFGFTSQLSKLYDEFVQVNGTTSFDEFLSEELLDPYSPPEDANEPLDEPLEKECHPVPIDLITVNATITFYTVASIIEIQPEPLQRISYLPYTENFTSTDLGSVFHPPRSGIHT
ncbi:MAG: hypothetical protein NTW10_04620 [Bacteroidetes bacterium]|nr:hypothetical protein [Bacteroidota bacterium]